MLRLPFGIPQAFYLENQDKVEAYLKDQDRLWREVDTA